jgi:hypothetical protein
MNAPLTFTHGPLGCSRRGSVYLAKRRKGVGGVLVAVTALVAELVNPHHDAPREGERLHAAQHAVDESAVAPALFAGQLQQLDVLFLIGLGFS